MRFVLLHYHILKNAGSTIEEILERNFPAAFARFDTPDPDTLISNDELLTFLRANPHVAAVSSHQIRHPVPTAPGFLFFDLCFLRDPLDRIRSTYDYFRKRPAVGVEMSDLANALDLGPFTAHLVEQCPWTISNVQVNLLSNGVIDDPPKPEDLELAASRMLATSFLGVVDRYEESMAVGRHRVRMPFPNLDCSHAPVNVSRGLEGTLEERTEKFREACGEQTFSELMRLNELDFELLRRARAEIDRRMNLRPDTRPSVRTEPPRPLRAPKAPVSLTAKRLLQTWPHRKTLEALFDAEYYRAQNPGAANPLLDFITTGAFAGRNPHPLFDVAFYLDRNPDIRAAGLNPLLHYLQHGAAEGRKPHPLFEPAYYLRQCPELRHSGENPLLHFLGTTPENRPNPHPLFDCESYLCANPDAIGINPLVHYALRNAGVPASGRVNIFDVAISVSRDAAPPEQRPFFGALSDEQLRAQRY